MSRKRRGRCLEPGVSLVPRKRNRRESPPADADALQPRPADDTNLVDGGSGDSLGRGAGTGQAFDSEVRHAAIMSAVWTIGGFALLQVLRFGSNLILTRLLAPDIFGVMALVNLFILGLHMFSDFGIQQSVIYSRHGDDPELLNSAWTIQAVRGVVLCLIALLIAWPLSQFYGEPALQWLIPAAGAGAAISGFNSSALFTLNRRLMRSRLVLMEVATYLIGIVVVIGGIWALRHTASRWTDAELKNRELAALVVGNLVSAAVGLVVSFRLLHGHRHAFRWAWHKYPELLTFGGWIVVSTMGTFLASQADRLVVGKISLHILGVYHIAAMLANMPTLLMTTLGSYLVFPLYSRMLNSGRDIRDTFGNVHQAVGALSALLVAGMYLAGPTAIACMYDSRYQGAGEFLQLLAVASWFTMLQTTSERALEARGQTRFLAIGQIVKLAALPPLLLGGFHMGGIKGMIVGLALAEIGRYALITWFVYRQGLPVFGCDLRLTGLVLTLTAAGVGIDGAAWTEVSPWPRLLGQVALVSTLWSVGVVVWLGRAQLRACIAALQNRKPATANP